MFKKFNSREKKIFLTTMSSGALKVLSMTIPLLTLKITYEYLNAEVFGLWNSLTTLFALFTFSDLGLGNGLQTKLSHANGNDDQELCRKLISSTFFVLLFISCLLLLIFFIVFNQIDWINLINAKSEETVSITNLVIIILVVPKLISIPVSVIQRTQLALQEGYRSDIWSILGYLLNVLLIIFIAKFDLGKLTLLVSSSVLPVLISAINMIVYFKVQRRELSISYSFVKLDIVKSLLSIGLLFSFLQVLISIGISLDTFIVARNSNLSEAAAYSILYKTALIFSAVIPILSLPLWGANGEAFARGDVKWVKHNTIKMSLIMGFISLILVTAGLLFSEKIFSIWLGSDFLFSFKALFWLSVMQVLASFISPFFMVLNASGKIRIQIYLFLIYTPICLFLKFELSQIYGVEVIPMVGSILYFFIIVIGTYYFSMKELNKPVELNNFSLK